MQLSVPALQEVGPPRSLHTKWMAIRNSPMRAFPHYRRRSPFFTEHYAVESASADRKDIHPLAPQI